MTYLTSTPFFKPDETGFMCDWQNLGMSLIMFDYQTQSNSIKRLSSITEHSIVCTGSNEHPGIQCRDVKQTNY